MEIDQAAELATAMQGEWTNFPLPIDVLAESLYAELRHLPFVAAKAAMQAWAASPANRGSAPSAGQILRKAAELSVAPLGWDQVRAQLSKRLRAVDELRKGFRWTCTVGVCDGTGYVVVDRVADHCQCHPAMVDARRGVTDLDPMVRAWIDAGLVGWDKIRQLVDGDTTAESQVRRDWEAYAARAIEDRVLSAMPDTGSSLRRIEQARGASEIEARRGPRLLGAAPAGGEEMLAAAMQHQPTAEQMVA
jgi:hypothetical protein